MKREEVDSDGRQWLSKFSDVAYDATFGDDDNDDWIIFMHSQCSRYYYKKEPDFEHHKRWRIDNPEKSRALVAHHARKRRARQIRANGSHTRKEIEYIFEKQGRRCANCQMLIYGKNKHLDHIFPLSKGGTEYASNLQWLCASCNCGKGAKSPVEWAKQNGRMI